MSGGNRATVLHVSTVAQSIGLILNDQLDLLQRRGYRVVTASGPGPLGKPLPPGVQHHVLRGLRREWDPAGDMVAVHDLTRIIARERIDILHTHMVKSGFLARLAGMISRRTKIVHTIHGLYIDEFSPWLRNALVWGLESVGGWLSDFVLFQNPDDLRIARASHMIGGAKARLIGNGIDLDRFDSTRFKKEDILSFRRDVLGAGPKDVVVGMVGRLVAAKGFPTFFEAAKNLQGAGARFVAVGPFEPTKSDRISKETVERLAGLDVVKFLGARPDPERCYAAMDIAVLPSRFPEGIPRALMEPAAMGKALVATDIKGCREVVDHGENGFLTRAGDHHGFAKAIRRLVDDAELRERMGQASARIARTRFNVETVVDRTVSIYEELRAKS